MMAWKSHEQRRSMGAETMELSATMVQKAMIGTAVRMP